MKLEVVQYASMVSIPGTLPPHEEQIVTLTLLTGFTLGAYRLYIDHIDH